MPPYIHHLTERQDLQENSHVVEDVQDHEYSSKGRGKIRISKQLFGGVVASQVRKFCTPRLT